MPDNQRTVFVSYSHDDSAHLDWVRNFVKDLRDLGELIVLFDQDLEKGASLSRFMERGISDSDKVLVIGTPEYKKKSLASTGVGFEEAIMGTEYMQNIDSDKFYPILRRGSFHTSFPIILAGRNGDDFTDDSKYYDNLQIVIRAIRGDSVTIPPLNTTILDLCSLSETFPCLPPKEFIIDRDSEIKQLELKLGGDNNENRIVFVSGVEGVGVTTLLALFAKNHPNDCISFFNDGYTKYNINPSVLEQSLANQLYYYLYNTPLQQQVNPNWSNLFLKLLQKTKSRVLFFVFDGFDRVPKDYQEGIKELLSRLPWGNSKFLFSGTYSCPLPPKVEH